MSAALGRHESGSRSIMRSLFRVAFYRFRATFGRRWPGYTTIILLVGLLGGLAMGSIAGARRTQSSFPVYAASTEPAQIEAFNAFLDPAIGDKSGYYPARSRAIAHLPHVSEAETDVGFDANLVLLSHLHTHAEPGRNRRSSRARPTAIGRRRIGSPS